MRSTITMEMRLFGGFGARTRVSAAAVVLLPNPVHAVLSLIVSFVSGSALMLMLQVEAMGLLFITVYVGAIAVLFLFVVMMLNLGNTNDPRWSRTSVRYGSGARVALVGFLGFEGMRGWVTVKEQTQESYVQWVDLMDSLNGMEALGQLLYTHRFIYLLLAGFVLLVARRGAIVLTLKVRTFVLSKRQQVYQQRSRDADRAIMKLRVVRESEGSRH